MQVFSHKNLSSILTNGLSLHLVEASTALSTIQERTLQGPSHGFGENHRRQAQIYYVVLITGADVNLPTTAVDTLSSAIPYRTCTLNSHHSMQASWYQRLQDVPRGINCDHSSQLNH